MPQAAEKQRSVKDDPTIRERIQGVESNVVGVLTYLDQLRPLPPSPPFVVHWEDSLPLMEALWHSPIKEDPRAGKIVAFYSKATGDLLGTTPTMVGGFQIIPPGDLGMAHKHSMAAILYTVSGHGYSVVNGQRHDWNPGDVVTFPAWSMHEHGNHHPSEPAIVFQVLDLPLIKAMRVLEMEELREGYQKINSEGQDATQEKNPAKEGGSPAPSVLTKIRQAETRTTRLVPYSDLMDLRADVEPCIFRWKDVEPALEALSLATPGPKAVSLLLHNKQTGDCRGTTPTLAASFHVLNAGGAGQGHRHPSATVQCVVKGSGYLIADGVRHEWGKGDIVAIPAGCFHEQGIVDGGEPAILFSISDFPLLSGMKILYENDKPRALRKPA